MSGVEVAPASLDGSANVLVELAGLLQAGRPEPGITGQVQDPKAHADVVEVNQTFAAFAEDQYQDAVAVLAALSTQLRSAAGAYAALDEDVAGDIVDVLRNSAYVPPEQRDG
ncbi:hypothetical protein K1W54_16025 [Micromonospora sp. CPCC 205371]|nr:hypothetical protein [Micromonospora sp. CPCC 205371]